MRAKCDEICGFVTEIAHRQRRTVTQLSHHLSCSRCPGEVPSSPWRLTGSGGVDVPYARRSPLRVCRACVRSALGSGTLTPHGERALAAAQHPRDAVLRDHRTARRIGAHAHHLPVRPPVVARPASDLRRSHGDRQRPGDPRRPGREPGHDRAGRARHRHRSERLDHPAVRRPGGARRAAVRGSHSPTCRASS